MLATLLKTEFLKYGRSAWFPMIVIFCDAILALVTILFMYSGVSAFNDYVYYNASPYLNYFLILSSIEVLFTLLLVPIIVSIMYNGDHDHRIKEQFAMIPGVTLRHTSTRIIVPVVMNFILFLSGLPMLMVACIYSDTSFLKLIRLAGMILAFSFWSASLTTLFHSLLYRLGGALLISFGMHFILSVGVIFMVSMIGNHFLGLADGMSVPLLMTRICLILLLLNPVCTYMGFYSNLTGDISLMSTLCGSVGIDSAGDTFSMLFYKTAMIGIILMAAVSALIACWFAEKTSIKSDKMEW